MLLIWYSHPNIITNYTPMSITDKSQKNNTRERILTATYTVLSRQGLARTSIKEIAAEAGVKAGVIHYHFDSKEQLLALVVKELSSGLTAEMQRLRDNTPAEEFLDKALDAVALRIKVKTDFYRVRFESYPLGFESTEIKAILRGVFQEARGGISESLRLAGMAEPDANTAMASIILACFDGLSLQYMIDPEFDLDAAFNALKKLFRQQFSALS